MVKWTSGRSERTFNQSAANGRNEPRVHDAALSTNGGYAGIGHWRLVDIQNVDWRLVLALAAK
jgi:hypothetical protein